MRDIVADTSTVVSSINGAQTATANGTAVDLRGFDSALLMTIVGIGGITFDGTNNMNIGWFHSDDNVTFTAMTAADLSFMGATNATGVAANGVIRTFNTAHAAPSVTTAGYIGGRRWVRPTNTFAGTHGTGTAISNLVVRGDPGSSPA